MKSSRHVERVFALISSVLFQNVAPRITLLARTGRRISDARTFSAEFVRAGRRTPVRLVRLERRFFRTRKLGGGRTLSSGLGVDDYRTLAAVGVARRKFGRYALRDFHKASTRDELRSGSFLDRVHDRLFNDGLVSSVVTIFVGIVKAFFGNVLVFRLCWH